LHWKDCNNCKFSVAQNVETVKWLIEKCNDCTFRISGVLKTGTIEAWRCKNLTLIVDTDVGTLQLDLSENITVISTHKVYLGSIVQAGINSLSIAFEDHPEFNCVSGLEELKKSHPGIDEKFDQYITRFIEGKLLTELVLRHADGFHTTEREKARDEADKGKGDEVTKEKLRNMIRMAGPAVGLNEAEYIARSQQGREAEARKAEAEAASNLKKHAGNKAFTQGQFLQAITLYSDAIELTPDNHLLYSNRAQAYLLNKELEKALADADKCIALKPDFPKGHLRRGAVLSELGRKEDSIKSLTEAHNLAPRDDEISQALAKAKHA